MTESASEDGTAERWQGVMHDQHARLRAKIKPGQPLPDVDRDYPGETTDRYTAVEMDLIERDGREVFRFRLNDSGFIVAEAEQPATITVGQGSKLANALLYSRSL